MNLIPQHTPLIHEISTPEGARFLDFGWVSRSKENILILPEEADRIREAVRTAITSILPKPSERLDAFDAQGVSEGNSVPRAVAHADGIWHNVVHIWLHDDAGSVFLQKRSQQKKLLKGFWDATVGGHVSAGQTIQEAALRELIEEAWKDPRGTLRKIGIRKVSLVEDTPSGRETNNEFAHTYALRFDGRVEDLDVEPGEADGFEMVTREALEGKIRDEGDLFALPKYFTETVDIIQSKIRGEK